MSTKAIEVDKELEEVLKLVSSSSKDVDALRRARAQADAIRKEMREKYGDRNIAVKLVRAARDDA